MTHDWGCAMNIFFVPSGSLPPPPPLPSALLEYVCIYEVMQ